MSADVQVVEIGDDNSLVPNLTISVDNEEEDDETSVPEIEYGNLEENNDKMVDESSATIKPRLNLFPRKKIYENKTFGGAAELGLSFEEAEANRKKRAQRFNSPLVRTEELPENNDQLLAKSKPYTDKIAAYNEDVSAEDDNFIRLDTIHMIGVNSMSTEDIFAYFGKTNPRHIEWVNDNSCNVVWTEQKWCAIAMEKVAHSHDYAEVKKTAVKETESTQLEEDEDDLDLDDMEMDVEESATPTTEPAVQPPPADVPLNPLRKCHEPFVKNKQKAHLEVRYAVVGDRKESSAAKKSKYYMKHGNPHFGGTKGLLTSTYRKKYHMKSTMRELRGLNVPTSQEYRDKYYKDDEAKGVSSKRMRRSKEYKSKLEKEDESLVRSTVKDLHSDGSDDDDSDEEYGTMVADQVDERVKAAREKSGSFKSAVSNNSVQSRLGKRSYEESYRSRRSPDVNVLERLPKDLRSRLGSKRSNPEPRKRDERSRRRDEEERREAGGNDSPLKQSYVKESSRELRSYSPPPWE